MLLLVHVCSNFGPKIVYPRLPGPRTRRQRLIERLDAGLPAMLTLACAPAGFGKTTLLAEWIAQSDEGRGTNANLQEAQAIEAKGGPV